MGMEISARNLLRADEFAQAGPGGSTQGKPPVGQENFDQAMQGRHVSEERYERRHGNAPSPDSPTESRFERCTSGRQAGSAGVGESVSAGRAAEPDSGTVERHGRLPEERQEGPCGNVPSPASLMESLFGRGMSSMQAGAVSHGEASASTGGRAAELVDKLIDRILVSDPGRDRPEVRLTLGEGILSGVELRLSRGADGLLSVQLFCPDVDSFQTAVGAQDGLRSALERTNDQVRVEVSQGGAEGGNEGDTRRRSATYTDDVEDA